MPSRNTIFIDPHGDDVALFSTFNLLREVAAQQRIMICVVFDSYRQTQRGAVGCGLEQRRDETREFYRRLLQPFRATYDIVYAGFNDSHSTEQLSPVMTELTDLLVSFERARIYAPAYEIDGHEHHNMIAEKLHCSVRRRMNGMNGMNVDVKDVVKSYYTYTKRGKTTAGKMTSYESSWVLHKLRALLSFESQINLPACQSHFLRSQHEFEATGVVDPEQVVAEFEQWQKEQEERERLSAFERAFEQQSMPLWKDGELDWLGELRKDWVPGGLVDLSELEEKTRKGE